MPTLIDHIKAGLLATLAEHRSGRFGENITDATFRAAAELIHDRLVYDSQCECGRHLVLIITRRGLELVKKP